MLGPKSFTYCDTISLFCLIGVAVLYSELGELKKKLQNEAGDSNMFLKHVDKKKCFPLIVLTVVEFHGCVNLL